MKYKNIPFTNIVKNLSHDTFWKTFKIIQKNAKFRKKAFNFKKFPLKNC